MAKPSARVRSHHASMTMTDRQAARIRSGVIESAPGDYQVPAESSRRQGVARRALEDMRIARELGLDIG